MKISYGPPGVAGVKNLQYLSGTDSGIPESVSFQPLPIAKVAGVVWLGAKVTGMSRVKRYAFWTAIGALVWHYAKKPSVPVGTG